jgi:hypothetical protein
MTNCRVSADDGEDAGGDGTAGEVLKREDKIENNERQSDNLVVVIQSICSLACPNI